MLHGHQAQHASRLQRCIVAFRHSDAILGSGLVIWWLQGAAGAKNRHEDDTVAHGPQAAQRGARLGARHPMPHCRRHWSGVWDRGESAQRRV